MKSSQEFLLKLCDDKADVLKRPNENNFVSCFIYNYIELCTKVIIYKWKIEYYKYTIFFLSAS